MSDWRDDEYDEEPRRGREPTGEGVRILGSEAGGSARPSFAAGDDEYDTWSASNETNASRGSTGETSGSMPLPHWTEPPTGEVPRILDDDTSDDLESWSALTGERPPAFEPTRVTGPRGDFEAGELEHDDSTLVGALDESPAANPYDDAPMSRKARREAREARSGRVAHARGGGPVARRPPVLTSRSTSTRTRDTRRRPPDRSKVRPELLSTRAAVATTAPTRLNASSPAS